MRLTSQPIESACQLSHVRSQNCILAELWWRKEKRALSSVQPRFFCSTSCIREVEIPITLSRRSSYSSCGIRLISFFDPFAHGGIWSRALSEDPHRTPCHGPRLYRLQPLTAHPSQFGERPLSFVRNLVSVQIIYCTAVPNFCCESFSSSPQECLSNSTESRNKDCLVP